MLAWTYLFIASVLEIGWPLGFKLSQTTPHRVLFILMAVVCMALSGFFLWMAQRAIPIGTAYAVWTGIGAAGTFLIGVLAFNDSAAMLRILSFLLIVVGVIGLRVSSQPRQNLLKTCEIINPGISSAEVFLNSFTKDDGG